MSQNPALPSCFPGYSEFNPRVPVVCVTPHVAGAVHRFYDTSPFSPSGRYLAVTRLPTERRPPRPGELADVLVIDLNTGETKTVAQTCGWDVQLGAQVQWGADDGSLFFNDLDVATWTPFGVRLDPISGRSTRLDGTVYMISADGQWSASPCLLRTAVTQGGYGVVVPRRRIPRNVGAAADDGIYLTSTATGKSRLLVSLAQIVAEAQPAFRRDRYKAGDFYGFHVKWNPQGTRLLFVLRWLPRRWGPNWLFKRRRQNGLKSVITMNADGSDIRVAVPDSLWAKGGHHPNWCPDGEHLIMNLNCHSDGLRFVKVKYDGSTLETLAPSVRGSGHPTLHPDGRHLLTDAYQNEALAFGDGTTPIRWTNVLDSRETTLVRIRTAPRGTRPTGIMRVDPHPAWDRSYRRVAFNACPDGHRRVYAADLSELLADSAALHAAA